MITKYRVRTRARYCASRMFALASLPRPAATPCLRQVYFRLYEALFPTAPKYTAPFPARQSGVRSAIFSLTRVFDEDRVSIAPARAGA